ncbi:MAG: prolipoprotein diacylglyceryl transferase [Clostridia bacterium]|nr:prolipoprotein diacylglyceryl transferase [Clostridia bacterium]
MSFFTDAVAVRFTGLDHVFNVSSVFCEIAFGGRSLTIRWYGVIIAFGLALAALYGGRIACTWKISLDKMVDVLLFGAVAGVIGARAYYVIFTWDYFSQHPGDIFKIWNGGLAIYGGIIGGLIAAFITARVEKINFLNLLDLVGMSLLLGQGIGRWGNFANQEAFGTNTDLPWGMYSEKVRDYIVSNGEFFAENGITMNADKPVHPTFLYESLSCLIGFAVLYIVCRRFRLFSGQLFLLYCVWYGAERGFVEGLRTDSLYIAGTTLRVSQLISFAIAAVALVILAAVTVRYKKKPWQVEGRDYFYDSEGVRQTDFSLKYNVKKRPAK